MKLLYIFCTPATPVDINPNKKPYAVKQCLTYQDALSAQKRWEYTWKLNKNSERTRCCLHTNMPTAHQPLSSHLSKEMLFMHLEMRWEKEGDQAVWGLAHLDSATHCPSTRNLTISGKRPESGSIKTTAELPFTSQRCPYLATCGHFSLFVSLRSPTCLWLSGAEHS